MWKRRKKSIVGSNSKWSEEYLDTNAYGDTLIHRASITQPLSKEVRKPNRHYTEYGVHLDSLDILPFVCCSGTLPPVSG